MDKEDSSVLQIESGTALPMGHGVCDRVCSLGLNSSFDPFTTAQTGKWQAWEKHCGGIRIINNSSCFLESVHFAI